jgi:hypothetical protein
MVEVGIFRKELHEMDMRNTGFTLEEIKKYGWVDLANGHEAVFEDSNAEFGTINLLNIYDDEVIIYVMREWCNDFKPLAEF